MSPQLAACIAALPEDHWKLDREEADAIREWAEVNYLPSDGVWKKDAVSPRRYLAIRIRPRQGELLRDGNRRAPLLHRHQPLRSRRRQRSRPDPLAPRQGRHHRARPRRADERTRRRRPAQPEVRRQRRLAAPQRRSSTTCSRPTSASAYPRNCTPPGPSGCASSCSTPSARSSATPARPSCAAPRTSPEPSPDRRAPASPSNDPS